MNPYQVPSRPAWPPPGGPMMPPSGMPPSGMPPGGMPPGALPPAPGGMPLGMPPGPMPPRPGMMARPMQHPGMMPPPPSMTPGYNGPPPPSSFPRPGAPPLQQAPHSHGHLPTPPPRLNASAPGPAHQHSNSQAPSTAPPSAPRPGPGAKAPSERPSKATTLVVSQISPKIDNDFLQRLMKACGPCSVKRPTDPDTGAPKLFCFVEFDYAESVIMALRVLNNLSVEGQDMKVKATNHTQNYISWWEAHRTEAGVPVIPAEEGEEGEDDDQREMRVMESVMDMISKRSAPKSSEVDDLLGSVRKEESSKARGRGPSREDRLEHEFEADRQRSTREIAAREKQEERDFKARLKEVERFEETIMLQRRKKRRQEEADLKDRMRGIKQDNEASDSEDEEDRWKRKAFRFTTAAAARRAARMKEAQEDESDRMKELEEVAATRAHVVQTDSRSTDVSEKLSAPAVEVKKEAKLSLNPNDGIMKAMLAAATAKTDDFGGLGGWQSDMKAEPVERSRAQLGGLFGAEEDARSTARRPAMIQYSEEEQRALSGAGPGPAQAPARDLAERRKQVIADVPVTPEGVWNWPLKWDMLRLDLADTRAKIHSKMCKVLAEMLGAEGAEGVADDVWKMLQQRSGPAAVASFCDFLGEAGARDFVFKTFRTLIAESELRALDESARFA